MVVIAPLVAAAGIQTIGGLAGGLFGRGAKNAQIKGDWDLQNYVAQQNAENNKMGLQASLGQGLSNNLLANVLGPDLEEKRQRTAQNQKFDFLLPKENALDRENTRWAAAARLDPTFKVGPFQDMLNANRQEYVKANAGLRGMFGRIGDNFSGLV
jgi:hypothetical protein